VAFDTNTEQSATTDAPRLKLPLMLANQDFFKAGPNSLWAKEIKPVIEEMSKQPGSDYTVFDVWQELYTGTCLLYIGVLDNAKLDFVGCTVIRVLGEKCPHIWLAHIEPQYRGGEFLRDGFDFIKKEIKGWGASEFTACAQNAEMSAMFVRFGMVNTFRIHRGAA
jgi:hypothetical protein